jgi:prolyl-tRNA synthetase
MQDGWALQAGTSHFLGQNFSKGFGIKFLDEDNAEKFAWQTSWGVSTRLVGALIMAHSDDNGLVLPPRLAPDQVVFVPIYKGEIKPLIDEKIHKIAADLKAAGIRCRLDLSEQQSPGWKFNEYELRGVPVRIEVGPKDLEKGTVAIARRDEKGKNFVPDADVVDHVRNLLAIIQESIFAKAKQFRQEHMSTPGSYDDFKELLDTRKGFLMCGWDGTAETEALIKEETKATIRCIPFDGGTAEPGETDIRSGKPAVNRAIYARAY